MHPLFQLRNNSAITDHCLNLHPLRDGLADPSDGLPDGLFEKRTNVYAGPDGLTGFYPQVGVICRSGAPPRLSSSGRNAL